MIAPAKCGVCAQNGWLEDLSNDLDCKCTKGRRTKGFRFVSMMVEKGLEDV